MHRPNLLPVLAAALVALTLVTAGVGTVAADHGPSDEDESGVVADVTPDFLSDLMADLPVPEFVKEMFGASSGG